MEMKEIEGSGCLIVEKKVTYGVGGGLGFSDSSSSRKLEKKRSRVVVSDSESSSDEFGERVPHKVYKLGPGLVEQNDSRVKKKVDELDEANERRIRKDVSKKIDLHSDKMSVKSGVYAKEHDGFDLSLSLSNKNEEDGLDGGYGTVGLQEKNGVLKIMVNDNTGKESSTGIRAPGTVKRDANVKTRMKHVSSVKNKASKIQRASYTEKQLLRERIKNMLFGAGWTIDYRPRRGRDYLDSVYISPSGNAYWSITKAYDALRKEEKDSSKAGDFTPLPNEILSKLTRQTRKKIEKEVKVNRKHEGNSRKSIRAKVKKLEQDKASKLLERRTVEESGDSDKETPRKNGLKKSTFHTSSHIVHVEKNRKMGRLALLVRGYDNGLNSEDNRLDSYLGKRNLLSWLIGSGIVSVGDKVEYMNLRKSRVMQEGWITEDGIHCDCCSKIITVLRFELHAGSKLGKPFQNVFLESGKSLLQCLIDGWNKQEKSERKGFHAVDIDGDDPNDDTCGKCGDGGDLICCDGCPSTFHLSCLDMQMLPQGDWHCPNCVCKYCERASRYSTKASGRTDNPLLTCRLCEKKYHKLCSPEPDDMTIAPSDSKVLFCEQKCRELYNHLQKLLWVKHELDSGFSWYLIHRSDPLPDVSSLNFSQRVESNSKLVVALSVMDECFLPIIDSRSGISLIHNVVYNCGSNFSRLNYSGFFTAILDKGDEIICAASIRIHGTQLAEMPFIGTRHSYRRQGMCRRLLNAIESALSSLKVEKLVIPAIEEHLHTWTNAFGFSPLEKLQKQEMRSINMLVFPGTDMLHKSLMNEGTTGGNITSEKGKKGVEVEAYNKSLQSDMNKAAKHKSDSGCGNPSECEFPSGNKSAEQSNPNVSKGVQLNLNEIAEGTGGVDYSSKVEANDLRNGNGTTDANHAAHDTIVTEVAANDSDYNSVQNDNMSDSISLELGIRFPGKDPDLVDAHDANNKNV